MSTILARLRARAAQDHGFTLVELLVVILIIGILAAVAIPTFLGQRAKGQDADAKSGVRNAMSMIESCFATNESYAPCDSPAALSASGSGNNTSGLNLVSATNDGALSAGQIAVTAADAGTYTIAAKSQSGNVFTIQKATGGMNYTCTATDKGACPENGKWGPNVVASND